MEKFFIFGAVALGGALGAVSRYALSAITNKFFALNLPLGTWMVNVIGCFLIGLLSGWMGLHVWSSSRISTALIIVGYIGAFTTFSTYAQELFELIGTNKWFLAFVYTLASNLSGILMIYIGNLLFRWISHR